jgi:hypothetical protein
MIRLLLSIHHRLQLEPFSWRMRPHSPPSEWVLCPGRRACDIRGILSRGNGAHTPDQDLESFKTILRSILSYTTAQGW